MLLAAIPRVEQRRIFRFFAIAPSVLALLAALIALVELTLVATRTIVQTPTTGRLVMPPMTAIEFILAGASLAAAQRRMSRTWVWVSRGLAIIVAAIALFVLLEYSLDRTSAIDNIWQTLLGNANPFADWQRMAINSALAFALFAQGIVFLDGDRRNNGLRSQLFAMLAIIIAFIRLVGHIFDVKDFYSFQFIAGMSLSSAITFTLLGLGLLFSQLNRGVPALVVDDGAAGFVARRLLPGAIFVPFALTV